MTFQFISLGCKRDQKQQRHDHKTELETRSYPPKDEGGGHWARAREGPYSLRYQFCKL